MSLINLLKKTKMVTTFTTPSHGQRYFIFSKLRQFYKYDISETDAHNPQYALDCAQKVASRIYNTKSTHFLTNGSTSGIIAAVLSCVEKADKVLIWSESHPAHLNAVELACAEPVFYECFKDENWGIFKSVEPENLENKLQNNPEIRAVIITSPTYEGIVCDVKKIKEICQKHSVYLIVDEAHGALHPFCDKLPTSSISQGADFVIQSLHKTAGGLNPTALLHCNLDKGDEIEAALAKINTTSPSYPLLASIEKNIKFLNSQKGQKMIEELLVNIEKIKNQLPNIEFYHSENFDSTKIVVKSNGLSGFELSEKLFDMGIEDERANEKSVMLLTGLGTDLKKLKRLLCVLKKIH